MQMAAAESGTPPSYCARCYSRWMCTSDGAARASIALSGIVCVAASAALIVRLNFEPCATVLLPCVPSKAQFQRTVVNVGLQQLHGAGQVSQRHRQQHWIAWLISRPPAARDLLETMAFGARSAVLAAVAAAAVALLSLQPPRAAPAFKPVGDGGLYV